MELACPEEESGLSKGISIIILEAEYDSADFQKLREVERVLIVHLEDSSIGLLIDFGHTNHVGGGFLSSLVRCYQRATSLKRRFVICSLKPWPRKVLAVTRLNSLWDIFETRQEAIAAMQISGDERLTISIDQVALPPMHSQRMNGAWKFDKKAKSQAFRVWVRPFEQSDNVRVDGHDNGKRLLTCLIGSEIVETQILGVEEPCGFYNFVVAHNAVMTHSMLIEALAGIPQVVLMNNQVK